MQNWQRCINLSLFSDAWMKKKKRRHVTCRMASNAGQTLHTILFLVPSEAMKWHVQIMPQNSPGGALPLTIYTCTRTHTKRRYKASLANMRPPAQALVHKQASSSLRRHFCGVPWPTTKLIRSSIMWKPRCNEGKMKQQWLSSCKQSVETWTLLPPKR